jgi:dCTP diphosphatase
MQCLACLLLLLLLLLQAELAHVGQELSDVLLYLLRLADVCGVDLGRAALQKLADNAAK